ncbi:hypothetical protein E4U43_006849 [Claviceps pusilla]|uniref:Uncharacterized protein n=1 Tax=Claviceps pusilla TaxID=123648 RepID=A0A9P7N1G1_9HYPO|nr:hypothetical protein E4U43_006849 [Claviceps pusilla]
MWTLSQQQEQRIMNEDMLHSVSFHLQFIHTMYYVLPRFSKPPFAPLSKNKRPEPSGGGPQRGVACRRGNSLKHMSMAITAAAEYNCSSPTLSGPMCHMSKQHAREPMKVTHPYITPASSVAPDVGLEAEAQAESFATRYSIRGSWTKASAYRKPWNQGSGCMDVK